MKKGVLASVLVLFLGVLYLTYLHLWQQSEEVNSNIYSLNEVLTSHLSEVWVAKFSSSGNWLASGSVDGTVKIWDIENGNIKRNISQPNGVTYLDLSRDETSLVTASYDSIVRLWKLPEGILVNELIGHTGTVWSVAFSPDGKTIASCGEDSTIKIWRAENGQLVRTLLNVPEHVQAAEFSLDDKLLLTGGRDKTTLGELLQNIVGESKYNKGVSMRMWDVQTGRLLQTFSQHTNDVNDVAFSPNGQWVASASSDATVQLWRLSNAEMKSHDDDNDHLP